MSHVEGMAGVKRTRLADDGRVRRVNRSVCDRAMKFGWDDVEED